MAGLRTDSAASDPPPAKPHGLRVGARTMDFPNQPTPFEGFNLFDVDVALRDAVTRDAPPSEVPQLRAWGAALGSPETYALADAANRNGPVLRTPGIRGELVEEIAFLP